MGSPQYTTSSHSTTLESNKSVENYTKFKPAEHHEKSVNHIIDKTRDIDLHH